MDSFRVFVCSTVTVWSLSFPTCSGALPVLRCDYSSYTSAVYSHTHVYLLFVAIHNTIAEYMILHSPQHQHHGCEDTVYFTSMPGSCVGTIIYQTLSEHSTVIPRPESQPSPNALFLPSSRPAFVRCSFLLLTSSHPSRVALFGLMLQPHRPPRRTSSTACRAV
jgi:hypothetical protein